LVESGPPWACRIAEIVTCISESALTDRTQSHTLPREIISIDERSTTAAPHHTQSRNRVSELSPHRARLNAVVTSSDVSEEAGRTLQDTEIPSAILKKGISAGSIADSFDRICEKSSRTGKEAGSVDKGIRSVGAPLNTNEVDIVYEVIAETSGNTGIVSCQLLLEKTSGTDIDTQFYVRVRVSIGLESAIIRTIRHASTRKWTAIGRCGTSGGIDAKISGIEEGIGRASGHALVLHHVEREIHEVIDRTCCGADPGRI
jgi:hypothetical protein